MKNFLVVVILLLAVAVVTGKYVVKTRRPIGEISRNKCQTYSEIAQCGPNVSGQIVNGKKAKPGEFPHMAAIGWKTTNGENSFKCGGSLISERFVLTVAHCCPINNEPTFVRLGEQNLATSDDGAEPKEYDILRIIKHENHSANRRINDIALLELEETVKFTKFIHPACLQLKHYQSKVIVTGWGKTRFFEDFSDDLMRAVLSIRDFSMCDEFLNFKKHIHICAGGKIFNVTRADACNGDSGGPIQVPKKSDKHCVYDIVGLTSFGSFSCGYDFAVYTNVTSYIDWIERKVWPNEITT